MKKNVIAIPLLAAVTTTLFVACSQKETDGTADRAEDTYADFAGNNGTIDSSLL